MRDCTLLGDNQAPDFGSSNNLEYEKIYNIISAIIFRFGSAQYVIKSAEDLVNLKSLPQEKVFVNIPGQWYLVVNICIIAFIVLMPNTIKTQR